MRWMSLGSTGQCSQMRGKVRQLRKGMESRTCEVWNENVWNDVQSAERKVRGRKMAQLPTQTIRENLPAVVASSAENAPPRTPQT